MELWHDSLHAVAAVCRDPVVVVGSTPPAASDLDVLVRDSDRPAVERELRGRGAVHLGSRWVVPGDQPLGVDVLTPTSWNLPDGVADGLWDRGRELSGHDGVLVPDPAHELLLAARRLAWNGRLGMRSTDRARWARPAGEVDAVRRAPAWHVDVALTSLLGLLDGGSPPTRTARVRAIGEELRGRGVGPVRSHLRAARVVAPRPRRGALVAVSGADGSGKSTVTHALVAALAAAGLRPVRRWMRFSHAPAAHVLAVAVKRLLGREEVHTAGHTGPPPGPRAADAGDEARGQQPESPTASTRAWVWVLTVLYVGRCALLEADRWRGRVVVCDRHVLDALGELHGRYGLPPDHAAGRVLRWLTASPTVALYLDVPPEVSAQRQDDDQWSLDLLAAVVAVQRRTREELGIHVVDAAADRDTVIATSLSTTFAALEHRDT